MPRRAPRLTEARPALAGAMVFLALRAAGAEVPLAPPPADERPAVRSWVVRGLARETYRGRGSLAPDESTNDLRLDLAVDATDPSGRWFLSLGAGAFWNIARTGIAGGPFGLGTVYDGRNPFLDVFHLYGEYQGPELVRIARAGRQQAVHGKPATFDGAYALLRPGTGPVSYFLFGGRTHHFFETQEGLFEDWIASAGATVRATPDLRLEVDYRWLREAIQGDVEALPIMNHSYGLSVSWRHGEALRARLGARGLDARLAEATASGSFLLPEQALSVEARGFVQPVALAELNELDDPLFLTLGPSLAHARWKLEATKGFSAAGGSLGASLGWAGRRLLRDAESPFNRNIGRLYAMVTATDVGVRGLFATLSLERLSSRALPLAGEGQLALNGAVGFERDWYRAELGTAYHRYQYVYFRDVEELADVRSLYAELRVRPFAWLDVRARYGAEVFDRVLHTVTCSVAQHL